MAAGLAVLLLPYSLIGPFAGALLDRWDRRRVLLFASLLRAVLVGGRGRRVAAGLAGPPLYVAALAVAGVSRFMLAGLSVALPHVVAARAPGRGEHPGRDGRGRGGRARRGDARSGCASSSARATPARRSPR